MSVNIKNGGIWNGVIIAGIDEKEGTLQSTRDSYYWQPSSIRTKYLCKQDIVDLGWEINNHRGFFHFDFDAKEVEIANYYIYGGNIYNLTYHKKNKWLTIKMLKMEGSIKVYEEPFIIYYGECKSKNEFRKICNWLKIN